MNIQKSFPNYITQPVMLQFTARNDSYRCKNKRDRCDLGNIKNIDKTASGYLKSIEYNYPIQVSAAVKGFLDGGYIENQMLRKFHSSDELSGLFRDLNKSDIGNIPVKGLTGFGSFAFAFETDDGNILKISYKDHYPHHRKHQDFDLPVMKSGRLIKNSDFYYYIEEKVTQNNISQKELNAVVEKITDAGLSVRDVYYETETGDTIADIAQFGRAKDGNVYLIDPGCAVENSFRDKTKFWANLFKRKF